MKDGVSDMLARARYAPAPTAWYDAETRRGKIGFLWNWMEFTFVLSLIVQAVVLYISSRALMSDSIPDVLLIVLWMETSVQIMEFLWYGA